MANTRHDRAGGKSARPRRAPQAKVGTRERIAAERAARKRAEARQRFLAAIAAVGAVLAVVVALVAVKRRPLLRTRSPAESPAPGRPWPGRPATVPAAVLARREREARLRSPRLQRSQDARARR